jgi:hypothetical protein
MNSWREALINLGWTYAGESCRCSGLKKERWKRGSTVMTVYPNKDMYQYIENGKVIKGKLSELKQ